jgi:DNA-binding transcriptional ArsR family regulator
MVKYNLDRTFAALADPTRRAILARLSDGHATVGELAEPFDMSLPAVSKHLKVLQQAGLIDRRRDGRNQICAVQAAPLQNADAWLARYRAFWEGNLDSLARFLEPDSTEEKAPS